MLCNDPEGWEGGLGGTVSRGRDICIYITDSHRASLIAQVVKNPPAMQETSVQSLGWEDPPEEGKATHSSILAWRIPRTTVHGVAKSRT